jgi:ankyrin repeat protein
MKLATKCTPLHTWKTVSDKSEIVDTYHAAYNASSFVPQNVPYNVTTLLRLANDTDIGIVNRMLENRNADVNEGDKDGITALHVASNSDMVNLFLDRGARIDEPEGDGLTPLMTASRDDRTSTVRALIARGANVNSRSTSHYTALMIAVGNNNLAPMALLLDSKADVNEGDKDGITALHVASNNDMVNLLLQHGALIDKPDGDGLTPLMTASRDNRTSTVRALLARGAEKIDVDAKTNNGMSALKFAIIKGYLDIVNVLILQGNARIPTNVDEDDVREALRRNKKNTLATATLAIAYGAYVTDEWATQTSQRQAIKTGRALHVKKQLAEVKNKNKQAKKQADYLRKGSWYTKRPPRVKPFRIDMLNFWRVQGNIVPAQ